ncbi:MAG TPA: competence/damage-inducible protein A [Acidobacteriaceae bacterium]|jgi:nicotinamide-nucleotide amidase|nr:competence/damage-inducible protein A [Acidobacteriaceae bacterium]
MLSEIIAVGSELLTPYRQDTNSLFLTEQLNSLGVSVIFKTIVGDRRQHLVQAVKQALGRTDIVIVIGGLGPTEDDLTRESVGSALGVRVKRDTEFLTTLYKRFAERRITMPENNAKQADVVEGAEILPNANGTAPGQWLDIVFEGHRKLLILLPGPPSELEPMFTAACLPRLRAIVPEKHLAHRVLKMALVPESQADARMAPIYTRFKDVETTILAHAGEIQLHLFCSKPTLAVAQARVNELASKIEEEMDELVYSSQGETLEQIALYYLEMRGSTLALAESCTGGLLAQRLTSVSGSSRSFLGGAVVYSNELKTEFTGVPEQLIEEYGAVSPEVAEALAYGIRRRTQATLGVGITGIAGPTGGTEAKPVGLVYIALTNGLQTDVVERKFTGDRERVRWLASQLALDMIRRKLM